MYKKYTLMHNDDAVAHVWFDQYADVQDVDVLNEALMPRTPDTLKDPVSKLRYWWHCRMPSVQRELPAFVERKILKAGAYSVLDKYWFSPSTRYPEITDNVSKSLFLQKLGQEDQEDVCPGLVTPGSCDKFWSVEDGVLYLNKTVSRHAELAAFREVLASKICASLGIESISPELVQYADGIIGTKSPCFLKEGEELVMGYQLVPSQTLRIGSMLDLLKVFQKQTIIHQALIDQMAIGLLLCNSNMHTGNIGFIQDSKTMKIIRCAPMFGLTRCFKYNGSDTLIYSRELTRKSTIHPDELEQCKEVFSRVAKQFESLIDADTIQVHQTKLNNAIEAYKVYRG